MSMSVLFVKIFQVNCFHNTKSLTKYTEEGNFYLFVDYQVCAIGIFDDKM